MSGLVCRFKLNLSVTQLTVTTRVHLQCAHNGEVALVREGRDHKSKGISEVLVAILPFTGHHHYLGESHVQRVSAFGLCKTCLIPQSASKSYELLDTSRQRSDLSTYHVPSLLLTRGRQLVWNTAQSSVNPALKEHGP